MNNLISCLDELGSLSVDFVSNDNSLGTGAPTGELVFHVVGSVAEYERDIIRERVLGGLANDRRKGKTLGGPQVPASVFEHAKA